MPFWKGASSPPPPGILLGIELNASNLPGGMGVANWYDEDLTDGLANNAGYDWSWDPTPYAYPSVVGSVLRGEAGSFYGSYSPSTMDLALVAVASTTMEATVTVAIGFADGIVNRGWSIARIEMGSTFVELRVLCPDGVNPVTPIPYLYYSSPSHSAEYPTDPTAYAAGDILAIGALITPDGGGSLVELLVGGVTVATFNSTDPPEGVSNVSLFGTNSFGANEVDFHSLVVQAS
jgi:hypothetical protein